MLRQLARRLMSNMPESTVYGGPKPQSPAHRVTLTHLRQKRRRGQPITVVTAYDYPSAVHVDSAGIDILLVGDSAAMVVHGHDTTLPITLDDMLLHCRAVARGASRPLLVGDLPFGFYESSASQAVDSAVRMLKEGGMDAIKLEGAAPSRISAAKAIVEAGIAVMGHVGLTPQAISILGGFRPQGKTVAIKVVETVLALQDAGCFSVVLECVPAPVAAAATSALHIPTIGIGAGPLCSGQHEKIMSSPRGGRLLVRFHRLTEAARSAIAVPLMASADDRTSTTGSKRLGQMANVAKRKQSFLQFFLMTGIFMLSMRSLSQKYRIRDLSDENALLAKERDAIALRSSAVKEALFQEATLDPSGLIADHVRSLFDEKPDH